MKKIAWFSNVFFSKIYQKLNFYNPETTHVHYKIGFLLLQRQWKKIMDAYKSEIITLPRSDEKQWMKILQFSNFLGIEIKFCDRNSKLLPVNIIFSIGWQIIIDDQGDLLDINTASQQIGGNKDTGRTRSELTHNDIALFLVHVTMLK